MIETTEVEFAGQKWEASFDFQQVAALKEVFHRLSLGNAPDFYSEKVIDDFKTALAARIKDQLSVIVISLRRRHPGVTREDLSKIMKIGELDGVTVEILKMVPRVLNPKEASNG
jgi:hypothetical protein